MRPIPFIITAAITTAFIIILNTKLLVPAPLGALLSPQHGLWQNAEPADKNFSEDLKFPQLKGKTSVYLDERLVPHIFAEQENDAYFVQGYLHAKFRLFQMDLQTLVAAGRAAEMVGEVALKHDKEFRRLGMVFAAETALKEMESNPDIKATCDAYTAGVNAYINSLTESTLPVEYKLLGKKPSQWSNFKIALFLKLMSNDLAGHDNDFEMTNAQSFFSKEDFDLLYPLVQDSLDPIIPRGTVYNAPAITPLAPASADSLYFKNTGVTAEELTKPDPNNGSNNWAVSGKKTASGAPILCNDPHLGLNLPSIWYEMQISTPSFNAYGATFPGSPCVIIGYNDSCAFGFTNGGRDVRDYYEIKFKDATRKQYWFNNEWRNTEFRIETLNIADKPTVYDTVAYTIFGPVMYDDRFNGGRLTNNKNYAVRWKAHDKSNDLLVFKMLNHAKNYADYQAAVVNLSVPGQNCVFACKNGDIAIRTQGDWPAKWKGQGDFVMPGVDSSYMWQGMIPQNEVPYQYNPERGFVSSANQKPTDATYPYYLGREYPVARGLIINKRLAAMEQITPLQMQQLQTDNYNIYASQMVPVILKNINEASLNADVKKYVAILKSWDLRNDVNSKGATVYDCIYKQFKNFVYEDEFAKAPKPILMPFESTLIEATLRDSAYKFFDNINTPQKETLPDMVDLALKAAAKQLATIEADGKLEWAKFKDTRVNSLLKLPAFSRLHLPIGGGTNMINATREEHGPSWRMVVSLTEKTEAYGVYPGGQNGNPGSKYYDSFIDEWVAGKYYTLWMMTKDETKDARVKWTINFSN
ncbi:penicillin acylase family protein [Ferruginibacter yonginensis]|uniref:Penicillin acylase family protein n=1 Tax=Ferruginibacter yonginensis TaxID=1310416 RepID=A0ABV8QN78_9BACT